MSLQPPDLLDPGQQFLDAGTLAPPVPAKLVHTERDRIALELAGAVLVMAMLLRAKLANSRPTPAQPGEQARNAWKELAPTWVRLALPAITHAYRLGNTASITDEEISQLATTYAGGLGDYLNDSSAQAFQDAINMQLAQRWSPELAWQRASASYGLDRRDMRRAIVASTSDKAVDPMPAAARTLVDRLMLSRAQRIGEEESYSAEQAGQAMTWLYLERAGRIAPGHTREWIIGVAEHHCPVCVELQGQRVALDQPFITQAKVKLWAPRAHPGCDCRIRINPPGVEVVGKAAAPIAAGLALVAADTGRVLMLQRAHDRSDPAGGTWEFPGGHVEGQDATTAAVREWEEEVRRKLPPLVRMLGCWRHGRYEGIAALVARESMVPTHTRGRVTNPDDPDGDQVEAIAWWDPAHLRASNPALRAELRESLRDVRLAIGDSRIAKADEHWKREPRAHGRWARVEQAEKVAQPVIPSPAPDSAFLEPSSLLQPSLMQRSLTQQSLLRPTLLQPAPERSPFLDRDQAKGLLRERPKALVTRIVQLPDAARVKPPRPPQNTVYYLPVDVYHEHTSKRPFGARYDVGGVIDFSTADSPPEAVAASPWSLLDTDHLDIHYVSPFAERGEAMEAWHHLVNVARLGHGAAMAEANGDSPIIDKLTSSDLDKIATMTDWERGPDQLMRSRLKVAVAGYQSGQSEEMDSLADAYADYVTFAEPQRLLGRHTGGAIEDAVDDLFDKGVDLRSADDPVPTQQVFMFEQGVHPRSRAGKDEVLLAGPHVANYYRYRSAMTDFAGDPPFLRVGLRETNMAPYEPDPAG